jgi:hypothetical protein
VDREPDEGAAADTLENALSPRRRTRMVTWIVLAAVATGFAAGYLVRAQVHTPATSSASSTDATPAPSPAAKEFAIYAGIALEDAAHQRGFTVQRGGRWVTHCAGTGKFSQVRPAAPFTVLVGSQVVGGGALKPGIEQTKGAHRRCLFRFAADDLPAAPSYVVTMTDSGPTMTINPGAIDSLTVLKP